MTDLQNVIQTGVGQAPIGTVYVGEWTYHLTVRFKPEALGNLFFNSASGVRVHLSQVANITLRSGESTITREMNQRNLTVRIDNRNGDLSSYLAEAQAKIAANVSFDKDKVRFEWRCRDRGRRCRARGIGGACHRAKTISSGHHQPDRPVERGTDVVASRTGPGSGPG
jgi:multidrug efflux pump subunit AcrB